MKTKWSYLLFVFLLATTLCSGLGCHWIIPFEAKNVLTYPEYYCSATISRDLPGGKKFTEHYETDLWPDKDLTGDSKIDAADAKLLCVQKMDKYIAAYLNPGFTWNKEYISIYSGSSEIPKADCSDVAPLSPTYGSPTGSALSWPLEGRSSSVSITLRGKDGNTYIVQPTVKHGLIRLAEHAGGPDATGTYVRGLRQIRISHMSLDLDDFEVGGGTVKEFHLNNIGTVVTDGYGASANIRPDLKMFFHGIGVAKETISSNTCYPITEGAGLRYTLIPRYFAFTLDTTLYVGGSPVQLNVNLATLADGKFNYHQPYVSLLSSENWKFVSSPVNLTPYYAADPDAAEPLTFLWFENFDDPKNEKFLGEGQTLYSVPFSDGQHEVTCAAYGTYTGFNTATSTLTIQSNTPPVAQDDTYNTLEDTPLVQGSLGILKNDTDANGDTLSASLVTSPANGTLTLSSSGGFTYKPKDNFFGTDTVTYRAYDGKAYSNTATVTITVTPVNDPPIASNDTYTMDEDTVLTVAAASGVLKNDKEVDGDPMTAQLVSNPSTGKLVFKTDGSFTYTPLPSYHGTVTFTYKAYDAVLYSDLATVTITVIDLPPDKEIPRLPIDPLPLNPGQKNSFKSKLDAALAQVLAGNKTAACNILEAFLNELQAYIDSKKITLEQAQPLIDKVKVIKAELGCK